MLCNCARKRATWASSSLTRWAWRSSTEASPPLGEAASVGVYTGAACWLRPSTSSISPLVVAVRSVPRGPSNGEARGASRGILAHLSFLPGREEVRREEPEAALAETGVGSGGPKKESAFLFGEAPAPPASALAEAEAEPDAAAPLGSAALAAASSRAALALAFILRLWFLLKDSRCCAVPPAPLGAEGPAAELEAGAPSAGAPSGGGGSTTLSLLAGGLFGGICAAPSCALRLYAAALDSSGFGIQACGISSSGGAGCGCCAGCAPAREHCCGMAAAVLGAAAPLGGAPK